MHGFLLSLARVRVVVHGSKQAALPMTAAGCRRPVLDHREAESTDSCRLELAARHGLQMLCTHDLLMYGVLIASWIHTINDPVAKSPRSYVRLPLMLPAMALDCENITGYSLQGGTHLQALAQRWIVTRAIPQAFGRRGGKGLSFVIKLLRTSLSTSAAVRLMTKFYGNHTILVTAAPRLPSECRCSQPFDMKPLGLAPWAYPTEWVGLFTPRRTS